MKRYDVVIVGGAAVGSAAAYFLAADAALRRLAARAGAGLRLPALRHHAVGGVDAAPVLHAGEHPHVDVRQRLRRARSRHGWPWTARRPTWRWHEGGYLFLASARGLDTLQRQPSHAARAGRRGGAARPRGAARAFPLAAHRRPGRRRRWAMRGEGWLDAYSLMMALRRKAVSLGAHVPAGARGAAAAQRRGACRRVRAGRRHAQSPAARSSTPPAPAPPRWHAAPASNCRCSRASAACSTCAARRARPAARWSSTRAACTSAPKARAGCAAWRRPKHEDPPCEDFEVTACAVRRHHLAGAGGARRRLRGTARASAPGPATTTSTCSTTT